MRPIILFLSLLVLAAFAAAVMPDADNTAADSAKGNQKFNTLQAVKERAYSGALSFRYIVKFNENVSASEIMKILKSRGITPISIHPKTNTAVINKFTKPQKNALGVAETSDFEQALLGQFMVDLSQYVQKVEEDRTVHALLQDSVPLIDAPYAWGEGYNGTNISVCVVDTGIDYFSSQLPSDFVAVDFTNYDWCIDDSKTRYTGDYNKFKLNVSKRMDWLEIGVWWISSSYRYDILVYAPNGTLIGNSSGSSRIDTADGSFIIVNASINNVTGSYTIILNATDVNGDWPTIMWGSNILEQPDYYYGQGCVGEYTPEAYGSDSRAFYNLHPNDDHDPSHGTHVAGIIAKQTNPKGVAPGAKLYIAKALDQYGSGYLSEIINALDWCVANNVDIISMSLGMGDSTVCTDELAATVNSYENDSLFVIAAGNSGPSGQTVGSPGCAKSALTVGAVDKSRNIASFSSRGPSNGLLKPEVVAPGVSINSTLAPDTYGLLSGTSMATPHVSGFAALLKQKYGNVTPPELKSLAIASTERAQCDYNYGCGLINATRALGFKSIRSSAVYPTSKTITLKGNSSALNFLLYSTATQFSLNATDGAANYASQNDASWNVQRILNLSTNSSAYWNITIAPSSSASGRAFYFIYPDSFSVYMSVNVSVNPAEIWTRRTLTRLYYNVSLEGTSRAECSLYDSGGNRTAAKNVSGGTYYFSAYTRNGSGKYDFSIFCYVPDFPEKNSSVNISVYYDSIRPNITANFTDMYSNTTLLNLTYAAYDNLAPYLNCTMSAGGTAYFANISANSSRTEEANFTRQGRNSVRITCMDYPRNSGRLNARVNVDTIAPNVTVRGITPSPYANANGTRNTTISYYIYDRSPLNSTYSIDGLLNGSLGTGRSGTVRLPLDPGNHTLVIDSWDAALNLGTREQNFTVP